MFSDVARNIVEERLANFELKLVEKFSENPGATQSFADPDFQGALHTAKQAYARSSSEDLNKVLADLVYRRALEKDRNRISLIVNDAIGRCASLSVTDFSTLSTLFYLLQTSVKGLATVDSISERFSSHLGPIMGNTDLNEFTLNYLHAQGLFLVGPSDKGSRPYTLQHVIKTRFCGAFNTGFTEEEILSFPGIQKVGLKNRIVQPCKFDSQKYVLSVSITGLEDLKNKRTAFSGLSKQYAEACHKRLVDDTLVDSAMSTSFPQFSELAQKYMASRSGVAILSPVGIAIAHSFLAQNTSFSGDLSIWLSP